jgi:hypothetical protein
MAFHAFSRTLLITGTGLLLCQLVRGDGACLGAELADQQIGGGTAWSVGET